MLTLAEAVRRSLPAELPPVQHVLATGVGLAHGARQLELLTALCDAGCRQPYLTGLGPYGRSAPKDLVSFLVRRIVHGRRVLPKVELQTDTLNELAAELAPGLLVQLSGVSAEPRPWFEAWKLLLPVLERSGPVLVYDDLGDHGSGPLLARLRATGRYHVVPLASADVGGRALVERLLA